MLVYAVKHKDEIVRSNSRSGGIFTAVSDWFLDHSGIVYGCVLDENLNVVHERADNTTCRDKMRGSKYVQSFLGDTFKLVAKDLADDKYVLFTGTSCQVAGLKAYLGKEYSKLLCLDIVCHGVPSPLVWDKYVKWQETNNKSKAVFVDFRNKKKYGWRDHIESLVFANGKQMDSIVFTRLFYGHNILRPSCYECPFKSVHHPGDITIADYWGIEKAAPEFDDNRGVSLVLVNSAKGEIWFDKVRPFVMWKETKIEDSMQPPLKEPFPKPCARDKFWYDFVNKDFNYIAKEYGGHGSLWKRAARRVKMMIKQVKMK